jgi:hypothetical protein
MKGLRLLLLLIVLAIVVLYRPKGVYNELKRLWARQDYVLGVLVFAVGIYLLYGLYTMYTRGWFDNILDW